MPGREATYEFPFTYPSRNKVDAIRNHNYRNAIKKRFQNSARWCLHRQGIVKFNGAVKIDIDLCFDTLRTVRRDKDNYAPKWLLDVIVRAGIITDDNANVIPDAPEIMFFDKEPEEKMLLRITELPGA